MISDNAPSSHIAIFILSVTTCVAIGTLMVWAIWNDTSHWRLSDDEQLASNVQRFDWATPECVEQEVINPEYRHAETNLRLCQLEHQLAELMRRMEE